MGYPVLYRQNHSSSTHGRPNPNPPTIPPGNQDPGRWHPREDVKILAKFKSMHNYIRVLEVSKRADDPFAGSRLLLLDNPGNIHSISFIFKSLTSTYFGVFATLPPIIPPGPIGILGFGAGSTARSILDLYPEVVVHGWELDPSVIGVGREYFGLSQLERQYTDRLIIHVGDAFKARTRGGSCVEAEDSLRHGKLIKEMQRVFGDKLFVLSEGNATGFWKKL
ncbi:uncharacterized protein [Pyrus communis]|uniref:uncharacterized protein n=1 Tax=Pyrus communis TaxID=23211 RepID=UPI0035BFB406